MVDFMILNFLDVIIAVIVDLIVGDPKWLPHPIVFIGKLIKAIEDKIRTVSKSDKQIKVLGGIMVLIVAFICFSLPGVLLYFAWRVKPAFHVVNIVLLWTTIAAKSLKDESMKVYYALEKKDIVLARKFTSYIVGRETKDLDEKELIRATVETVAENTSDGVIAPLFYGFIGGAPLAMMYKGINTMDSMVGYISEPYTYIGFFPAKIDDVFNYVPARITGFVMCMTALFMSSSLYKSLKIMIRDRKNHKSPNCAYPEAAVAAILKIQLGGNNVYFGEVIEKPTIGDKIRELKKEDITSSNKIMFLTEFLFIVFISILVFLPNFI